MKLRLLGSPKNFPALPRRWDGVPVRWEAWEKEITVTHLDISCDGCGLASSLWHSSGLWEERRRQIRNFQATRCGWCGHTTVYTMHDRHSWDLDASDYTEYGSCDRDEAETLF